MFSELNLTPIKRQRQIFSPVLETIIEEIRGRATIMGGFVRWLATPLDTPLPEDIDIFCRQTSDFDNISERLSKICGTPRNRRIYLEFPPIPVETPEGRYDFPVTLICPAGNERFTTVGSPETIVSCFDFSVIRIFLHDLDTLVVDSEPTFLDDEENLRLRIAYVGCPISEFRRIAKYTRRGYRIPLTEIAKVFRVYEEMPFEWKLRWFQTIAQRDIPPEDVYAIAIMD